MSRFIEGSYLRIESLDGRQHEYVIASKRHRTFSLKSLIIEGRTIELELSELQEALKSGKLEFITSSGDEEQKLSDDLNVFSLQERSNILRKYQYVTGLINRGIESWTPQMIEDQLPSIAQELKDNKPPSWRTVCRWHKSYVKANYSVKGLYSKWSNQGNRSKRMHDEVEACIQPAIDFFISPLRPTRQAAYEILENKVVEINLLRRQKGLLEHTIPSYQTFLNRLAKVTPYAKRKGQYGQHKADIEFNPVGTGVVTSRVMERISVDHTRLDLFVIDSESGLPLGRPWLTLAVDEYSRSIVGFYISFRDPDFIVLLKLIRSIVEDKRHLNEQFPFLQKEWLCYGIPELFVFDNGREFWCDDLEKVLAELNIQYTFNPVQHPWYKGKVERKFGAINTGLLSQMSGKTFNSIAERDDYNPKKNAVIRFNSFIDIFYKWVIDEYQITPTTEEQIIPNVYWNQSVDEFPPRVIEPDRMGIILGRPEESKLRRGGIYFKKIRYESEELAAYRATVGSVKASYKVDPDNLSAIYVYNTLKHCYMKVSAVDTQYTQNLNEVQHDVHAAFSKKMPDSKGHHEDRVRARIEIQRKLAEELDALNASPKQPASSTMSSMAKYLDIAQDAHSSLSEGFKALAIPPEAPAEKPSESTVNALSFENEDDLDTTGWSGSSSNE